MGARGLCLVPGVQQGLNRVLLLQKPQGHPAPQFPASPDNAKGEAQPWGELKEMQPTESHMFILR